MDARELQDRLGIQRAPRVDPYPGLFRLLCIPDPRHAPPLPEHLRPALERVAGEGWLFDAVRLTTRALCRGQVLTVNCPDGAVTAGRGKLVDWRTVRSGDVVLDGAADVTVALGLCALVGANAVYMIAQEELGRWGAATPEEFYQFELAREYPEEEGRATR